jgi:preprotein translocase subunit SecF
MKNKQHDYGRFDFVGNIGLFGGISLVLTVASLIYLAAVGINYGIDFRGGTEVQVKFNSTVNINQVRDAVEGLGLGDVGLQSIGDENEFVIRFQTPKLPTEKEQNEEMQKQIASLKSSVNEKFKDATPEFRRVDTVGPQVGAELKRNGFLSVFYCLLVILGYVAFRFDYQYAPGAVICLFHDAVITLAIYNFVGKEMNVQALAAIMTLIGFSLNDTIVVFDRIRETVGSYRERGWAFIINKAINDMLVRTIITSGTVLTSAFCLYLFAEGTVKDIAFALTVGILFGVYSSIYVAAPLILIVDKLRGSKLSKIQAT